MTAKKRIIYTIALAFIIGSIFGLPGKVNAAVDTSVWHCIQTVSRFDNPGVIVYVNKNEASRGHISKDGKRAIYASELENDDFEDDGAYFQLPSGYCVASGVAIRLKREVPVGNNAGIFYYYSLVKGNL